jgi:hypothetical protein
MKTAKIKTGLLIAAIMPLFMGCPKSKNTAPELDTEVQSSIDASFATFMVTDIDMICGFVGEGNLQPNFYVPAPGDHSNYNAPVYNPVFTTIPYDKTLCMDGRVREGSIHMSCQNDNPNALYYNNYEFKAAVMFSAFKVDGWSIETKNNSPCYIYNRLSSATYNPAQTNITWLIDGSFQFTHPTDPSKNMTWTGKLTKTLANTSDVNVFNPSRLIPVNWSLAKVEYRGTFSGVTSANVPYTFVINDEHPLIRDFTCYPDVVGGVVSVQPFKTWSEEFHPFKSGIVSFTTGDKYPRQIYFGNEGEPQLPLQCDNSGEVLIKGITYKIDFMK